MIDLHRHDEFSSFDGFGKAKDIAVIAKELGYDALGLTNHGNLNGLVQHYNACKEQEIKPILGVEAYFQPLFNKEKPRYHLCIFAKNLEGYKNMNKLMFKGEQQKYYNPIITFADLEEYSEGLICSSACVGGYIAQMVLKGKLPMARKALMKFHKIFGDDFYVEIQPYIVDNNGSQEKVNAELIKMADELGIKCIFTSDSHYGRKEDFDTYKIMHDIANHSYDIEMTYGERYMPTKKEFLNRFYKMHSDKTIKGIDFKCRSKAQEMVDNLQEIVDKCEEDIFAQLPLELPEYVPGKDSYEVLVEAVKEGLKTRNKDNKKYRKRCKQELEIIKMHGFADYFMIVHDYVNWAKAQGIGVGPGRGSVCNCEVAYALGITDVDSIKFNLDFRRFLREDKKKLPDIDLDFETSRRGEVIKYIVEKYKGHAAQICSYGNYMIDNLINDLVKVCGMEEENDIKTFKKYVRSSCLDEEQVFKIDRVKGTSEYNYYNKQYNNILKHFEKMYKKVRFIGTHAAGVAVTGGNILDYTGVKINQDGTLATVFNLTDLESINVIKFDILGLSTMEQIVEMRALSGDIIQDDWFDDQRLYEEFGKGNTDGIFQFESNTAKQILQDIHCDCFEDVIAGSSMNRPGPLALRMPEQYAHNKFNQDDAQGSRFWEYTKETYGSIVYQEQLQQICIEIGGMTWPEADKVMKCLKNVGVEAVKVQVEKDKKELTKIFVAGAQKNGFTKQEAIEMFEKVLVYTFNKGHGAGYSIISLEEMHYKIYHPNVFWFVKMKYAKNFADRMKYAVNASRDGALMFIPHVNYTADYSLRKIDGEPIIQEGLISIKGVGEKAAQYIENERKKKGPYKSYDDFIERCQMKGSPVNKGVISKLFELGCLQFNKKMYMEKVIKYNSVLYAKSTSERS